MSSLQKQKHDNPGLDEARIYSLEFLPVAKKELEKLEKTLHVQLLKKLRARLQAPRVQADKLRGMPNCYKLKLRASGVRLVYEVIDGRVVVSVIAVGRRDNDAAYLAAKARSSGAR